MRWSPTWMPSMTSALGPVSAARWLLDLACRRSFPTPAVSFYRLSGLSALPRSRTFGRYNLTYPDPDQQAEVDSVVGAFMLMRTAALEQAGLLDEAFFMYGEDPRSVLSDQGTGLARGILSAGDCAAPQGAASRKNAPRHAAFYEAMKIFHDKHYRAQSPAWVNWAVDAGVVLMRWAAGAQPPAPQRQPTRPQHRPEMRERR